MILNKSFNKLSIIIPCFNEEQNLRLVTGSVGLQLEQYPQSSEIVLVDDGSTDDSWALIQQLRNEDERIKGIRLSRNFGKEAAIAAGLAHAEGDLVILMDSDLQHPPELIPQMIEIWCHNDVEIVEAVKQSRGDEGSIKNIFSRVFYVLFNKMAHLDLRNASDYKLLSRRALDAWSRLPERNLFFRGMSLWIGYPRAELPFSVSTRAAGKSGWGYGKLTQLAISALTAYSSAPLRLVALSGMLFSIFALILGLHTLFNYFSGQAVSGFTTVILLLLLVGAAILFGLAVIGEYIARIYEEIKQRPRYIIADTTDTDTST
jgi:glycosyltransferase involved in cell wall biosynthesis